MQKTIPFEYFFYVMFKNHDFLYCFLFRTGNFLNPTLEFSFFSHNPDVPAWNPDGPASNPDLEIAEIRENLEKSVF